MVPDATSKGFGMFHHQPEGSPPTRESDSDDQVVPTVYRLRHEAATHSSLTQAEYRLFSVSRSGLEA